MLLITKLALSWTPFTSYTMCTVTSLVVPPEPTPATYIQDPGCGTELMVAGRVWR